MSPQSDTFGQRLVLCKILQPDHFQSNHLGCCKNTVDVDCGLYSDIQKNERSNCYCKLNSKLYFEMYYKYGTIYREVMHSPRKIDWCFFMNNLDMARKGLLFKQFVDLLESISPGFVRPCPWKVTFSFFLEKLHLSSSLTGDQFGQHHC